MQLLKDLLLKAPQVGPEVLRRVAGVCLEQAAMADVGGLMLEKATAYFELAQLYERRGPAFETNTQRKAIEYYKKCYQILQEQRADEETHTAAAPLAFSRKAATRRELLGETERRLERLLAPAKNGSKGDCAVS